MTSDWSIILQQCQDPQGTTAAADEVLRQQYSWLSERALTQVPEPLKRDVETRAVERFFINWIIHPSNHGLSPGHMHELPMHFHKADSSSILWFAVRALAFADMKHERVGNISLYVKARQQYGAALGQMRTLLSEQGDLASDHVLFSTILLDNFELIHLGRDDPLGPHSELVRHILRKRGDGQLYSPTKFSLWRLTHYRLQSWQTLFREYPEPQQIAWISKLSLEQPDLRICAHVLHMNTLSAIAKGLTQNLESSKSLRIDHMDRARQLAQEMQDLAANVENWTSEMKDVWNARIEDPDNIAQPQDVEESPNFPIPQFPYPQLISYDDLWLAYIWNFYAASQIVLRESLIDIITYAAGLEAQDKIDDSNMRVIQQQRDWVNVLSEAIIGSFPMLLGFTQRNQQRRGPPLPRQGKMAGRLFALFSMWVIQRARFTSEQHKQTAAEVVAWVNSRHGLD